ncbi:MAG: type II toxin-antitoxin system RelE/ParE family toxin [Candidatus Sedimenticola sp. (ex Thyasira tokunagai)]
MKEIEFLGDSLDQIRDFSQDAKQDVGFQLDKVQRGEEADDWKPMNAIGSGVKEIRIKDADGIYRVIYLAKLEDVVYVLHAFQKKTQKTRKADIDLASRRLKRLLRKS